MSLARRETGQDEGQKAPLSFRERDRGEGTFLAPHS